MTANPSFVTPKTLTERVHNIRRHALRTLKPHELLAPEFHRVAPFERRILFAHRIDFSALDFGHRHAQVFRILEEGAPEQEHIVGARAVDETLGGFRTGVARRQQHIGAALALVGAGQADVTTSGFAHRWSGSFRKTCSWQ